MSSLKDHSTESFEQAWTSCRPSTEIQKALEIKEPIIYKSNGNRARSAKDVLKKLKEVMPQVGITRLAEISQLDSTGYPVFQAIRPNIFTHVYYGQNTGSQGKGPTKEQAQVSAIMESIESYCAEAREADLIYGSYNYLSKNHFIIPPNYFAHIPEAEKVKLNENLSWTWAYNLDQNCPVLVPAETVFYPFMYEDHSIKRHFLCGSNGLASGSTYLEAINHALYEVIERYYWGTMEIHSDRLHLLSLKNEDFKNLIEKKLNSNLAKSIRLISIRFKKGPNIPMVLASYTADGITLSGLGCAPNIDMAVSRAVSEAIQSMATLKSGSREDSGRHDKIHGRFTKILKTRSPIILPFLRISKLDFANSVKEQFHSTLNDEFNYLVKWIHQTGFNNICIANLTRVGIDIPVVKVLIPAMPAMFAVRKPAKLYTTVGLQNLNYRIRGGLT